LQTRRYRAGSLKRLLIETRLFTTLAIKTLRPNRHKVAVPEPWFPSAAFPVSQSSDSSPAETMRSSEQAEPTSSMAWESLAFP
jgi:hypothetical protein